MEILSHDRPRNELPPWPVPIQCEPAYAGRGWFIWCRWTILVVPYCPGWAAEGKIQNLH